MILALHEPSREVEESYKAICCLQRPQGSSATARAPTPRHGHRACPRGAASRRPRLSLPTEQLPLLRGRGRSAGTFFGVDTLECSELTLCLETGLLGTCCASGSERPSTSARMHSWYSWDLRKRV